MNWIELIFLFFGDERTSIKGRFQAPIIWESIHSNLKDIGIFQEKELLWLTRTQNLRPICFSLPNLILKIASFIHSSQGNLDISTNMGKNFNKSSSEDLMAKVFHLTKIVDLIEVFGEISEIQNFCNCCRGGIFHFR